MRFKYTDGRDILHFDEGKKRKDFLKSCGFQIERIWFQRTNEGGLVATISFRKNDIYESMVTYVDRVF